MKNPIVVVDETDNPIGKASKEDVWSRGLRHRTVHIMIENDRGDILLQHRSATKDIFPDTWDAAVGGHVDAGEDYIDTAKREALEELSLQDLELIVLGKYKSDETWQHHRFNRFTTVYKASLNETPQHLEAGTIDKVKWFSRAEVVKLVLESPDKVADGLRQAIEHYYL
jgi:isopentenyldiphosphate isomerase